MGFIFSTPACSTPLTFLSRGSCNVAPLTLRCHSGGWTPCLKVEAQLGGIRSIACGIRGPGFWPVCATKTVGLLPKAGPCREQEGSGEETAVWSAAAWVWCGMRNRLQLRKTDSSRWINTVENWKWQEPYKEFLSATFWGRELRREARKNYTVKWIPVRHQEREAMSSGHTGEDEFLRVGFEERSVCSCVCVRLHVWICMSVCVWRPKANLWVILRHPLCLGFWDISRFFLEVSGLVWPADQWTPEAHFISASPAVGLQT